jgi:hypothetical protein
VRGAKLRPLPALAASAEIDREVDTAVQTLYNSVPVAPTFGQAGSPLGMPAEVPTIAMKGCYATTTDSIYSE